MNLADIFPKLPADSAFAWRSNGTIEYYAGAVSLKEAQRVVGGYVQLVTTKEGAQILCNEEGKLQSLPRHEPVTALVRGIGLHPDDYIAGDVVVLTGKRRWA